MPTLSDGQITLEELLLDPNNYRFQDSDGFMRAERHRFPDAAVQERAYRRLREDGVAELKNSILKNGLLPIERLVVSRFNDQFYLVVEGNRRLAALRWIKEDHDSGVAVPEHVLQSMTNIPVVIIASEDGEDLDAYEEAIMGVRHVSGIKQWGGY